MIPLFSTDQIREVDDFAISKLGIPGIVLMENASIEIYRIVEEKLLLGDKSKKIGIICGRGNNGGDGFAAARHFVNNEYEVIVLYLNEEDKLSPDSAFNFRILKKLSKESTAGKKIILKKYSSINDINKIKECDVILDAMLGSGAKGDLREPYKSIIRKLNRINAYKVAVDIPTGLDADTGFASPDVFKSDLTITLGEFKKGLFFGDGYINTGEVVKGYIGIGSSFYDKYEAREFLIEPEDAYSSLPGKSKNLHKYSAGKVLTIAGSGSLPGAAVLTAKAVLKIGAGASILCFPKSVRKLIFKNLAEVVVHSYQDNGSELLAEENFKEVSEKFGWADVLAIGPGLGRNENTQKAVLRIIKERKAKRMVIDADALFALRDNKYKDYNIADCILTPHYGEFALLTGIDIKELRKEILRYGREFVEQTKSYLVLKGAPTLIFLPNGEVLINTTGNPGMAKFGTGDVLTGVIAGLIAQLKQIETSVVAGVYIHSLAADLLLNKFTELGYTASDIIDNLPRTIKFLRKSFA
jgi:hydroxyethylthiazole kinase-like uncharacterized protein yjeF